MLWATPKNLIGSRYFVTSGLKVAIISDIHGNFVALDTVVGKLRVENVTKTVCLGDVIEGGPQPRPVLQKLKSLVIPVVAGNADEEVLDAESSRNYQNDFERNLHDIDNWTLSQLSSSDIEYVRNFMPSTSISLSKKRNLFCIHGSPRSNREGIFPTTSEDDLAQILPKATSDVIACGHTHSQMFRRYLKTVIINPGSVGMPFQYSTPQDLKKREAYNPAFAEYAILDYSDDGELNVELRRVPVDLQKLISSIRESGMPHANDVAKDWRPA
jgi:putative phosphoesterase